MPGGLNRLRVAALAIMVTATALALAPAGASADPCGVTLQDSAGFDWDLQAFGGFARGEVEDGENDAYDSAFSIDIQNAGTTGAPSYYAADNSCTAEDGGREIVFPSLTADAQFSNTFGGLAISRKFFVPATGTPFARWLNIIQNPTGAPISTAIIYDINWGHNTAPLYRATSSGDQDFTTADRWATHSSPSAAMDPSDQPLASLLDSNPSAADTFDTLAFDFSDGDGELGYLGIVVPAGGTVILMNFEAQRSSDAETLQFAQVHQAGTEELYAGISMTERSQLVNWPTTPSPTDGDLDGVPNALDNCPGSANANQANLDGDALGDVCDPDQDGDGLPDSVEIAIGSNPRSNNSDGDALPDGRDACPTRAGTGADGCPALTAAQKQKKCKKRTNKQKREGARKPKKCRKK